MPRAEHVGPAGHRQSRGTPAGMRRPRSWWVLSGLYSTAQSSTTSSRSRYVIICLFFLIDQLNPTFGSLRQVPRGPLPPPPFRTSSPSGRIRRIRGEGLGVAAEGPSAGRGGKAVESTGAGGSGRSKNQRPCEKKWTNKKREREHLR